MKNGLLTGLWLIITVSALSQSTIPSAEDQLKNVRSDEEKVDLMNQLGLEYYNSDPQKTQYYVREALNLAKAINYKRGIAEAYFNESLIYKLKGQDAKQIESLQAALQFFNAVHDSLSIADTYLEIANGYQQKRNWELSQDLYIKALAVYRKMKSRSGEALVLRKMGINANEVNNPAKALEYYEEALQIEKEIDNQEGIASVLNNIGTTFIDTKEYEKALPYLRQALEIHTKINNRNRLPAAYYNLGRAYLRLGKIKDALELAQLGYPIAVETDNRRAIFESTLLQADIFYEMKDFKKAFQYLQLNGQIKDSLNREEDKRYFETVRAMMESEQKDQQIQILKQDQEVARLYQWFSYLILFVVVVLAFVVIFYQRKIIINRKRLEEKMTESIAASQSLSEKEIENTRLVQGQFKRDLEFRNRELLSFTHHLAQKNLMMEELRDGIREVLLATNGESKIKLAKLIKLIDRSLENGKDWDEFRSHFEKVHPSFFADLIASFPELSEADLRLCALICLNFGIQELSDLLGLPLEGIPAARARLSKKLKLDTEESLADFISTFRQVDI